MLSDLRVIAKQLNVSSITKLKKNELIDRILEEVSGDGASTGGAVPEEGKITIGERSLTESDIPEKEGSMSEEMESTAGIVEREKTADSRKNRRQREKRNGKPSRPCNGESILTGEE